MLTPLVRNATFWGALIVTAFNALSAIAGSLGVLFGAGLGMPTSMLAGGPFTSFVIPGVVLLVVVGGTQSWAAALLVARRESALLWTSVAGIGMLVWIFVETVIVHGGSWLQVLYFTTGSAQIVLVLALLGVVHWLPRMTLRAAAVDTGDADLVLDGHPS